MLSLREKKPLEGTESLQCSISLQWKAENKKINKKKVSKKILSGAIAASFNLIVDLRE